MHELAIPVKCTLGVLYLEYLGNCMQHGTDSKYMLNDVQYDYYHTYNVARQL